jgi:hydrogenase maturation factor
MDALASSYACGQVSAMMHGVLPTGKLPVDLLRRLLEGGGPAPAEVLLPPAVGEDAAAIAVGHGALIATTDPITLTTWEIGAHSVVINANDVAVMGVRPRWYLAVLLLPPGSTEANVQALFDGVRTELARVGATLVGGHTEVTTAVKRPVVIGQMLGFQEDGRFIRTGGVRAGDIVLQIGAAPIEGGAVLANEAADRLTGVEAELLAHARNGLRDPGISVVDPALRAAALGATALHDPTEGGLSAGLYELAEASGVALRVDVGAAHWFAPGKVICDALGADPWGTLASGCLLASFSADQCAAATATLRREGHAVAELACAESGAGVWTEDGRPLIRYEQDEVSRVLAG